MKNLCDLTMTVFICLWHRRQVIQRWNGRKKLYKSLWILMDFRNGRHASSMNHKNLLYFSKSCLKTGFNPSRGGGGDLKCLHRCKKVRESFSPWITGINKTVLQWWKLINWLVLLISLQYHGEGSGIEQQKTVAASRDGGSKEERLSTVIVERISRRGKCSDRVLWREGGRKGNILI